MKEQEAIDYFNNVTIDTSIGLDNIIKTTEIINISIKALEKQIPKDYMKELSSDGFFKINICQKCEDVRGLIKSYNFCPWCGQAIKWD